MKFGGIDVGKNSHFACFLDMDQRVLQFAPTALRTPEVVEWMRHNGPEAIAVDSPPAENIGILADLCSNIGRKGIQTDRRIAEFKLHISGVYGTPRLAPDPGGPRAWMAAGFELYEALREGLGLAIDLGDGHGRLIETHPTYAFKACIGHRPSNDMNLERFNCDPERVLRPKRKAAGAAQRKQLLIRSLDELNVPVTNEHRLRWEERIDWVDATLCALVAAWRNHFPGQIRAVGDNEEGSIWLRFPSQPFEVPKIPSAVVAKAQLPMAPFMPSVVNANPNACILRLGKEGPAGMNQEDTLDCALLAAQQEDEVWFPVVFPHCRPLEQRLVKNQWWFCAAWEGRIRLRSHALSVAIYDEPTTAPAHAANVWVKDGTAATSRCWVQLNADTLEEFDLMPTQFQTWQHDNWRNGFGRGQTALVRGVIPD